MANVEVEVMDRSGDEEEGSRAWPAGYTVHAIVLLPLGSGVLLSKVSL